MTGLGASLINKGIQQGIQQGEERSIERLYCLHVIIEAKGEVSR